MTSRLDELKRRARKAIEHDIARVANHSVRKGAEIASASLFSVRQEIARLDREHKISQHLTEAAESATSIASQVLRQTGAKAAQVASEAKAKAADLLGQARRYSETASNAAQTAVSAARLSSSIASAVSSLREWIKQNPGKATTVSLALIAGARAGSAFSSLDVALLGTGGAGHWFFHSAIVPYGLRKLSEKYEAYLKQQEELLREGKLSEAEQAQQEFERNLAKYVGAPLLGAFSVAMGASLIYEAIAGATVTGLPINLVISGNPLLSSIWLFSNGLVCIHNGYKFFMMGLADEEDVARVAHEIRNLLPVTNNE
jgi:ElaB/YqjD/DUF883 family membrane-anchored ribosome-binding protein